jgi:exosortase/archaeosortase family protein
VVEVTDGCSGIRSLQSLVMVALFFGELFLLPTSRRLLLILLAGLAALVFNTLRSFWLASVHFNHGIHAADAAHDRIGHTTFLLSAATLWLAAYALLQSQPRRLLQRTISSPTS